MSENLTINKGLYLNVSSPRVITPSFEKSSDIVIDRALYHWNNFWNNLLVLHDRPTGSFEFLDQLFDRYRCVIGFLVHWLVDRFSPIFIPAIALHRILSIRHVIVQSSLLTIIMVTIVMIQLFIVMLSVFFIEIIHRIRFVIVAVTIVRVIVLLLIIDAPTMIVGGVKGYTSWLRTFLIGGEIIFRANGYLAEINFLYLVRTGAIITVAVPMMMLRASS